MRERGPRGRPHQDAGQHARRANPPECVKALRAWQGRPGARARLTSSGSSSGRRAATTSTPASRSTSTRCAGPSRPGSRAGSSAVRKLIMGPIEGDVTEEHYIERDLAMLYDAICRIRLDLAPKGKIIAFPGTKAAGDGHG
jgi:hypothetical protein